MPCARGIPSALVKLDELRGEVERGAWTPSSSPCATCRGALQGKRLTARHFADAVAEHGAEACNYLLAVDVDMETVDGYAMSSWERGYGDFVMQPDLSTLRARPLAGGHGAAPERPAWDDGSPVVASPRQILRAQLDRLAERGWTAIAAHRARVHPLPHLLRGGASRRAIATWTPRQPLQRRLLAARDRAGRAAHPPDPQRDDGRRHGRRELQGRMQLRPARDQLPLRRGAARPPTSTRSTRTARRRSPPRRAWRSRSWRSSTSARATRATSTSRCATRRTAPVFADRARGLRPLPGRAARDACASSRCFLAPNINSYKRFASGVVRADGGRVGHTTTAPAPCACSGEGRACASSAACRAPTSIPTSRSRR